MATYYKLIERRNMAKDATPGSRLLYAQAKSNGISDINRICELIRERSTVSSADVKAVLDSLVYVMKTELSDGKIVQLPDFGHFRITFGSEGVVTEKEFHSNMIRRPKYTFTPGRALREQAKILKYEKYKTETVVETEECKRPHAG